MDEIKLLRKALRMEKQAIRLYAQIGKFAYDEKIAGQIVRRDALRGRMAELRGDEVDHAAVITAILTTGKVPSHRQIG